MTKTPEYRAWSSMKSRCTDPGCASYPGYGGRGIKVCRRWLMSFESFFKDLGPRPSVEHSLDRVKNDRGYAPSNCRWATREEQAKNRRTSRLVTIDGVTKTISEWSKARGVARTTLARHLTRK